VEGVDIARRAALAGDAKVGELSQSEATESSDGQGRFCEGQSANDWSYFHVRWPCTPAADKAWAKKADKVPVFGGQNMARSRAQVASLHGVVL
jgi:hypothetical protein